MNYTQELLDNINTDRPVIIELNDNIILIGYLQKDFSKYYKVLPLSLSESVVVFSRSQIKKIIYYHNRYVLPKSLDKDGKLLSEQEIIDYLASYGYTYLLN